MTTMPALTTHQRKVLDYMLAFFEANDQLPPTVQIARDFGYASPNSAQCTLDQIEAKGYLARNELGRRMFARPVLAAARQTSAEVPA
jgi:SOS-response transcriptional repressor LexA